MESITSILLGQVEHTPETKDEDENREDEFSNQAGVVLNFRHAFDIPHRTALGERAHEKAKEQKRTLNNYHPSHSH